MERPNQHISRLKGSTVVKAELGTKRTCPSCAARFYDLLKNPIVCPKCGANFVAASVLPSKGDMPAMAPAPKPRVEETDDIEVADVELVSLEDAEAPDAADDETAGIEDVDLGEEAGDDEAEDDTFLVEEEEEGDNMSGLLDTGGGKEEDEES
jgi:uncharacterized protein (TIGR02300 family)